MAKVADNVYSFLKPIVDNLGYELVEVAYEKKENGMNLTVYIDKQGGITIEDCEKVHHAIDEPLDELNPTDDKSYTLNVSSLGVDRPFKTDRDFEKNIGEEVEVNLFKQIDRKKHYEGVLAAFDDCSVTIESDGKQIKLERKMISKISKLINF